MNSKNARTAHPKTCCNRRPNCPWVVNRQGEPSAVLFKSRLTDPRFPASTPLESLYLEIKWGLDYPYAAESARVPSLCYPQRVRGVRYFSSASLPIGHITACRPVFATPPKATGPAR